MKQFHGCPKWTVDPGGGRCRLLKVPYYRLQDSRYPSGRDDVGCTPGDYFMGRAK